MMLIPEQKITIRWGRTNKSYYIAKGYTYSQMGDELVVSAEDLMPTSKAKVKVICDDCGREITTTYQAYLNAIALHSGQYYCKKCVQSTPETRAKTINTLLSKYGVHNVMEIPSSLDKIKQTNLRVRGVEFPTQSKVVKDKIKLAFETNGTSCGFQNPQTLIKAQKALQSLGKVPVSRQQSALFDLLQSYYPNAELCNLNYPVSNLSLDIALKINGIALDIETDGEYWHQNAAKDRARDEIVKSYNFKILRIRFSHKLPEFLDIIDSINKLLFSDHSYCLLQSDGLHNNN